LSSRTWISPKGSKRSPSISNYRYHYNTCWESDDSQSSSSFGFLFVL
jgi:hypothetical protein